MVAANADRDGFRDLSANPDIPPRMLDVMRRSQEKYLEGSGLIKAGDSTKARAAFDQAVDLVLQSEWEISASPDLNNFFLDLIRNIQRDESRYLLPAEGAPEGAVVDEIEDLDLIPIQVDPELKDAVEADLLNTKYDIPVLVNESVLKSMNYWLNRGRQYFVDGLTRSGRYKEMIERIFREESIPLDLMYLAQVESLFKPNAVSRAAARGIWQFVRGTAIRYGLRVDRVVDERSDPEKSTRAAAHYLNDLYAMFGDWNLVLAAYNWGEGKVQSLVNKSGVTDFWQLAELKRRMPAQTKNHVPMIMASIILARNPEKYGLPLELEPPLQCDKVPIPKRINLKTVAQALDISVDMLKSLNPALRTSYTPSNYPGFELNVPFGMGADLADKLAHLPQSGAPADPDFSGQYRVQPGDTLGALARRFRVSVEDLQAANGLSSPKSLRAGIFLQVPANGTAAGRAAAPSVPPADFNGQHVVRAGETLSSIARRYGVAVTDLQGINGIRNSESLPTGITLRVPAAATSRAGPDAEGSASRRHLVQKGETLSSIAARYGVTVAALQKVNGIRSPQSLQVGVWLQIPSPKG